MGQGLAGAARADSAEHMNQRILELPGERFCESPDHTTGETRAFHVVGSRNHEFSESLSRGLQDSLG